MKNLKNLGEILNKEEQQSINGGSPGYVMHNYRCNDGQVCPPQYPCCTINYTCIAGPITRQCR